MRIAFFGDVVGRSGREALIKYLHQNKTSLKFDVVIVNGENAAHGFGITQPICDQFFEAGVDVITLGNHSFDQKNDLPMYDREKRLVRPLNYPKGTPGHGFYVFTLHTLGKKIMVVNLMGRVFMELNDDPFVCIDDLLSLYKMGGSVDSIFVDFHAEATAEKTAIARYLDGRVTAVIGTHTHVPTSDLQILPKGTGYLSDAGMCGDYNSIIGMQEDSSMKRFTHKIHAFSKMTPAGHEATVCGVIIDVDQNGLCENIKTIKKGGFLLEQTN